MKYLKLYENIDENSYINTIKPYISCYNVLFNEKEINDVSAIYNISINYKIDIGYRKWGIDSISIYDFKGPNEINLNINYYTTMIDKNGDIDYTTDDETILLKLDWDKVKVENENEKGIVCVGELDIELMNDVEGNIIVKEMTLKTYGL